MLLNVGDMLCERYLIEEKIGQGGMSYVYKASDTKLGRVVAIKVLKSEFSSDEEFIKKFKNEAKAAAKLSHPNIVTAYDTVDDGNLHYIIMELVEGITLKNYIARKGKLSNKETLGIAIQAAEGIEEAHKKGIIHRDIKPQNIIISKDGKVKVADFGIAKAVSGETINPSVIGSVHYISPEQARLGTADARSDLYSLGITMYEMITGRVPFAGDNTVNVVMAHISEAMVPPSVYAKDIYPALNDIILKATRKQPDERYQSAGDLILDLKRCGREPEGHFVKMYASADDKKSEPNARNGQEKNLLEKGKAPVKTEIGYDHDSDNDNEVDLEIKEKIVTNHNDRKRDKRQVQTTAVTDEDQKRKLIKAGFVALAAVVIVIMAFSIIRMSGVFKSISKESEESTAQATEETSTVSDTTDGSYNITIYAEDIMPNLVGLTVDAAKEKVSELEVSIDDSTTDFSDVYYEGLIIDQDIKPDEGVVPGTVVKVTVSLGTKINYALKNIKDKSVAEATRLLNDAEVKVSPDLERAFSEEIERDRVISWQLSGEDSGHTAVNKGSTVKLIVSSGSETDVMIMPRVIGLEQTAAEQMIQDSGLVVSSISSMPSPDTPKGFIIGQSIPEETRLPYGTGVDLIVSSELDPLARPIQQSSDQAEAFSSDYYYGSIDKICTVGQATGPDSASDQIMVAIRLKQRTEDGSFEYSVLEDPKPVAPGTRIPVSFRNIKGIYGVDKGDVQVYNAETNELYNTYTIDFKSK